MPVRWPEIARLQLQYGNLDRAGFQDLLQITLRDLGKSNRSMLHELLLDLGIRLRPCLDTCPPDDMRWKYWVSMAMRYFSALSQASSTTIKPTTVSNVRHALEHDRVLMQALLFGNQELVHLALREDTNLVPWRSRLPEPSPEQVMVLDIICYHVGSKAITERQVGNWSAELHEEWAVALQDRLQVGLLLWFTQFMEHAVSHFTGADTSANPAMFEHFMRRFREANLDWAYGQALGYHNELKRRYRQAGRSALWILAASIGVAFSVIAIALARLLHASPAIYMLILVSVTAFLLLVAMHVLRVALIFISASGHLESQIQTLSEIETEYLAERE